MLICRNAEGMHHQRKVGDPWNRQTDISSGTEFIAPDVLFKTTNAGAPKKLRLSNEVPQRRVFGGEGLLSNLIVK